MNVWSSTTGSLLSLTSTDKDQARPFRTRIRANDSSHPESAVSAAQDRAFREQFTAEEHKTTKHKAIEEEEEEMEAGLFTINR